MSIGICKIIQFFLIGERFLQSPFKGHRLVFIKVPASLEPSPAHRAELDTYPNPFPAFGIDRQVVVFVNEGFLPLGIFIE